MTDQQWLNIFCKGGYRGTKEVVDRLEAENKRLREELERVKLALECTQATMSDVY